MTKILAMGRIVSTPGALEAMEKDNTLPTVLLDRHRQGDWGDLCEEDRLQNEVSIEHGLRVMSSYKLGPDAGCQTIWVITEADRSVTTLLLPEEY